MTTTAPTLPPSLTIQPLAGPFEDTLHPPGSKSLTNRALLIAALADGPSTLSGLLLSDDTRRMLEALTTLGLDVDLDEEHHSATITGLGGKIPAKQATLDLGNAGTAMRPLAAACCLGPRNAKYTLDGIARMRQRPIGELVDPLRQLGGKIDYLGDDGFPPLEVRGGGLKGGRVELGATLSSQFVTALLLVGPLMRNGLTIAFTDHVTSRPYVELTMGLMNRFGVQVEVDREFTTLRVEPGSYPATRYHVEPDASNATYFLAAAAAIPGSRCTIEGLGQSSLQGDAMFADVLAQMGADVDYTDDTITCCALAGSKLQGVDVDLNDMPDAAMTLATLGALAEGDTIIRNIGNWRVKETDRMAAMQTELNKLGCTVTIDGDDLHITPPASGKITPAAIDTYDDHRMAMSFAVIGLPRQGVTINDPACVNKTYPEFFTDLRRLALSVKR